MKKYLIVKLFSTNSTKISKEEFRDLVNDLKYQIDRIRFRGRAAAYVDIKISID